MVGPARIIVPKRKEKRRKDSQNTGSGPERLAPWWPLLEQVLADDAVTVTNNSQQPGLPLTEANLVLINQRAGWEDRRVEYPFNSSVSGSLRSQSDAKHNPPRGLSPRSPDYPSTLHENGVLGPSYSSAPRNVKVLERMMARSVPGVPSEDEWKCWVKSVAAARDDKTLAWDICPLLSRHPTNMEYRTATGRAFDRIPRSAPFNAGLRVPCPDFVQGIGKVDFGRVRVDFIPGAVLFKGHEQSVTLAHIAGEFFGSGSGVAGERAAEARSAHTGAALTFARINALKHLGQGDGGDAHVITFTTNGARINFFAHYAKMAADGTTTYFQYPLALANMRDTYAGFKRGWMQLRNCQRYALEAVQALRDELDWHHRAEGRQGWACGAKPLLPSKEPEMRQARIMPRRKVKAKRAYGDEEDEDELVGEGEMKKAVGRKKRRG